MKRTYIFGNNHLAEILLILLERENVHVDGFVLNRAYVKSNQKILPRPLYGIEDEVESYGAENCNIYLAIGYNKVNRIRKTVMESLKAMGVNLCTYIHPSCTVDPTAKIGNGCILMEQVIVSPLVEIGECNIFFGATQIAHHCKFGSCNYVAASVAFCGSSTMKDCCFIGSNATIANQITLGNECVVGAGAFVPYDLPDKAVFLPPRGAILKGKTGMNLKFFNF